MTTSSAPAGDRTRNYDLITAVLITLLGAATRLYYLGHDSLWFDEILTRLTAVQGLDWATNTLGTSSHLPLMYALVGAILRVLPESDFVLRLPSAVAGILAIPLLISFGRAARLPGAGLWSALLLALLPFHVHYSQEARHYALLLFFSLLTLYWLYRALLHNSSREWLFFGLATAANMANHFSSWLLLAAEGLLIAMWAVAVVRRRGFAALLPAVPAALISGVVLLFSLPRLQSALTTNAGVVDAGSATPAASITTWLREIWLAFGFGAPLPALVLLIGALLGAAYLLIHRRWLLLGLLVLVAVVPVLFIQILQISRWALPKYVIFMLPLYLFSCGISLQLLTQGLAKRLAWPSSPAYRTAAVALPIALLLLILAWRPLQEEKASVVRDWRGAVAAVQAADVVVAVALDTADGYNAGGVAVAHYLDPAVQLLDGNHLSFEAASRLSGRQGRLAGLALNSHYPVESVTPEWQVTPYEHGLFALQAQMEETDILTQLAALYEILATQADAPSPQCALQGKLALVLMAQGQVEEAREALSAVDPDCPLDEGERADLQTVIDRRLLATAVESGDRQTANQLAAALLARDPGDELAIETLTEGNLLDLFKTGQAEVDDQLSPEPVDERRFTMPQDGDAGDVLFMHPPAAAHFSVELPDDPVTLRTRAALDPQSWTWGGDGVTFVVRVQNEQGEHEIFRRHIANDEAGQRWHPVEIPLSAYAGESLTITLATENGPAGDGTGDWAGWETPRLLHLPLDS